MSPALAGGFLTTSATQEAVISQHQSLISFIWLFDYFCLPTPMPWGFPGGSDGKASACNAGDSGLIPGLGRSPGEGNGSPLQHSCLESPMDGGAW